MDKFFDINSFLLNFKFKRINEKNIREHTWVEGVYSGVYMCYCKVCKINISSVVYNNTGETTNMGVFTCDEILIKNLLE